MKKQITLLSFFLITAITFGQGIIRGKVTDEKGETLIGAQVYLKGNTTIGAITDFDGNYSLNIPETGAQTLVISFISYNTIEEEINFNSQKVLIKNYTMNPATMEFEDIVIRAKANRANDAYMKAKKIQSAISIDYISTETIKKTGDSNLQDAVKRVSGVSTIGSFITVRGLADRYIKTTVNGLLIPTLDPFTNNIKLDLFPTSLVDNIVISKTASAKLPGDWSGAYLSIETKDYPNKFTLQVKSSFGYNDQATFEDIISSQKSSTDWLGYDNGFRDMKHLPRGEFPKYQENPNLYNQYIPLDQTHPELGLKNYINYLGINDNHLGIDKNNIYNRLMLVQIGLLAPGLIDDPGAIGKANTQFETQYKDEAFYLLNNPAVEFAQTMPNNWQTIQRRAPMDFSQEFSLGNQTTLFGNSLGYILGFRYSQSIKYDPASQLGRYDSKIPIIFAEDSLRQQSSVESNGWSALANIAYKFSRNHSVSVLFMPNIKGANKAKYATGKSKKYASEDLGVFYDQQQLYEETQQLVYQYASEHYFPGIKLKAEAKLSYTDGKLNTPDFKTIKYGADEELTHYEFPNFDDGARDRMYRYLFEDVLNGQINFELPVFEGANQIRKLSFGGSYLDHSRDYEQYNYAVDAYTADIPQGDLEQYFDLQNFRWNEDQTAVTTYYDRSEDMATWGRNSSTGYKKISAAYIMVDFEINRRLRLASGLRAEHTDMFSDQTLLLGLPNDAQERNDVGFSSTSALPAKIDQTHYLPNINLIYKLSDSEKLKISTRVNYSESIARPNSREISYVYAYDYELNAHILGNPGLKISTIKNYDFRIESFFQNGDNLSVSLFYKDFFDFIELTEEQGYYTWRNKDHAWVRGIEVEARKKIFKNLEVGANATLVHSETIGKSNTETWTLPLFGQAPYVINGLLTFNPEKIGLSTTLSYNAQGEKLSIVDPNFQHMDVYELPRNILDFTISKNLGKHYNISLKVRDILNEPITRAYKYEDFKLIYDQFTWGTNYIFSFSYTL